MKTETKPSGDRPLTHEEIATEVLTIITISPNAISNYKIAKTLNVSRAKVRKARNFLADSGLLRPGQ